MASMRQELPDAVGIVASRLAAKALREIDAQSGFVNLKREASTPWFDRDEIILDKMLGEGGFNSIYSVHGFDLSTPKGDSTMSLQRQQLKRARIASRPQDYVIKFLSEKTTEKNKDYAIGSLDLVIEAKILANLRHPNIITLHGVTSEGINGLHDRCEGSFFIVLDKLSGNLRESLRLWKALTPPLGFRLSIASQISEALNYLCRKRVLHRDIKPENIGLLEEGTVKLFDFGLAKVLPKNGDEFKLSGLTGTIRYMSPQCARKEKYGLSSDVYSFALVLSEIVSLETPYPGMKAADIVKSLKTKGAYQPRVKPDIPVPLKHIILRGCDEDPSKRPTMHKINKIMLRLIKRSAVEDSGSEFGRYTVRPPMRRCSEHSTDSEYPY
jgi:serine/threonine protein kinase